MAEPTRNPVEPTRNPGFLPAYFARIGYSGDAAPTLETIAAIHAHHTRAIPFENLSSATGMPVDISQKGLEAGVLARKRGGYCFQHSGLMARALTELGVPGVENHLGRVYWGREPGSGSPARTHAVTIVTLDGASHLVDAGFGGFNPSGILPLGLAPEDAELTTPLGTFRVVDVAEAGLPPGDTATIDLMVQARLHGKWANLYGVDLRPNAPVDVQMANWYVSTSPATPFTNSLTAAILTETERFTLANLALAARTYAPDGSSTVEKRTLGSAAELRAAACEVFRIEDDAVDWARAFDVARRVS